MSKEVDDLLNIVTQLERIKESYRAEIREIAILVPRAKKAIEKLEELEKKVIG